MKSHSDALQALWDGYKDSSIWFLDVLGLFAHSILAVLNSGKSKQEVLFCSGYHVGTLISR